MNGWKDIEKWEESKNRRWMKETERSWKWKRFSHCWRLETGDSHSHYSTLLLPFHLCIFSILNSINYHRQSINCQSISQLAVPLRFCQFLYQLDSIRFEWQSNHRRRDNNSASSTFVLWMEMDSLGEGGTNEPNEFYLMRPVPRSLQEDDDLLQHKLRSAGMSATYRRLRRSWKKIWADLSDRRRKTLYNEFEI